jgi:hypothetical protein
MRKLSYFVFTSLLLSIVGCSDSNSTNKTGEEKEHKHTEGEKHHDHDVSEEKVKASFPVEGYEFYGLAEVKPSEAVTVEEMVLAIQNKGAFDGNVSAVLDGVCKKMGCWVTMVNKSGESVRVRFKDHEFGVPTETAIGTEVVLRGLGTMDTTTIELQKHYLDDAKEAGQEVTQEQYDEITEDLVEVSFISDGILVKK